MKHDIPPATDGCFLARRACLTSQCLQPALLQQQAPAADHAQQTLRSIRLVCRRCFESVHSKLDAEGPYLIQYEHLGLSDECSSQSNALPLAA